ncbi:hypothetical protein NM688_g8250 [Phlebia brevispora]|uniref:Uncharacterized protein n=1 Tax=Phlebia brevispora TaxID=194682 RepID=A0ACC1RVP0_9APHY|nr:hypothetical protein NM688_g8250 [Phlebia brevispora]
MRISSLKRSSPRFLHASCRVSTLGIYTRTSDDMAARPTSRVRQSWATYDALVEKAFAKHEDPTMSPEPTVHPLDTVPDNSLDPLWEKVWELKSRALAAMPSKVKSLDTAGKEATGPAKDRNSKIAPLNIQVASRQTDSQEHTKVETPRAEKLPKLKRKSSATFCTSPDGRFVTATFDMLGVHKQDMHVSFRANWVVVTWRRVKTTEKMEDRTLVRERKEKQYCQSIPLPEGTTVRLWGCNAEYWHADEDLSSRTCELHEMVNDWSSDIQIHAAYALRHWLGTVLAQHRRERRLNIIARVLILDTYLMGGAIYSTRSPEKAHLMTELPRTLDERLYNLGHEEIRFLKEKTGITDDNALKIHILKVQADIYAVHPYHCIRGFGFAKLKISRFPAYKELLRLGKERPGALFLDMACCVGNDVRKAIADGFPQSQALASDLHPEFWDAGHKLFKTTPETFPVPFIPGDAFNPDFLLPSPIPTVKPTDPLPPLNSLTSLTPLVGRLSAIHTSSFFHLFPEEKQLELAKLLAPLLSPEPGSVIFGGHGGLPQKGLRERKNSHGIHMFCHSPASWKELWETQVFNPGQVRVDAFVKENIRQDVHGEVRGYQLIWSVTRLW